MSTKRKVLGTLLSAALLGALVTMAVTYSAFEASTSNEGNQFRAGTVVLSDNDSDVAAFDLTGMVPGQAESKCIEVAYSGSLDAGVKLYGATSSSTPEKDLAPYLDVEITRGSFPGAAPTGMQCDGFVPGPTLFDDKLSAYPKSYATGIADSQAVWHSDDTAVYRISVQLADDDDAQGKDATAEFTWQARDVGAA